METIILATHNKSKLKEIQYIFATIPEMKNFQLISMSDAGIHDEILESGTTYEENAVIKAEVVHNLTGQMVMADDSGIEIDALAGEPGVYSARYLGEDTTYDVKSADILRRMHGIPRERRTARYVCSIAFIGKDNHLRVIRCDLHGHITEKPSGENGFAYDNIFEVGDTGRTVAELSDIEKVQITHRAMAVKKICQTIPLQVKEIQIDKGGLESIKEKLKPQS